MERVLGPMDKTIVDSNSASAPCPISRLNRYSPGRRGAQNDTIPQRSCSCRHRGRGDRSRVDVDVCRRSDGAGLSSAGVSPDGTRVVTTSIDKTARLWEAATGESIAVLSGHEDGVLSAVFSPDGTQVVTASNDKTARLWATATGASNSEPHRPRAVRRRPAPQRGQRNSLTPRGSAFRRVQRR